jgi:hypothetical protein
MFPLKRNVVCEGNIENSSLLLLLELERLPFQFPTVKLLYGLYSYRHFTVLRVQTIYTYVQNVVLAEMFILISRKIYFI